MSSELYHYGVSIDDGAPGRGSGRYPKGSGKNPYQHMPKTFLDRISEYRDEYAKANGGKPPSDAQMASYFDMTTRDFIARRSLAKEEARMEKRAAVLKLADEGLSDTEIGRKLGINESSVRSLKDDVIAQRQEELHATMAVLADGVSQHKYIQVGEGVESAMNISKTRLDNAVVGLRDEGYEVYTLKVPQLGSKDKTVPVKVLCEAGTTYKEVWQNKDKIALVGERFKDIHGTEIHKLRPIENISSKKIQVAYAEDGGTDKDGVIELRRGAKGLDMGAAQYAQVRIGVDGTHYLKGMAVYTDDLPKGVDIRFNTNKSKGTPLISKDGGKEVLKKMEVNDPTNPFGAAITTQRGYLNIVNEEGKWDTWSRTLASQMLSKQPYALVKRQLSYAKLDAESDYKQIHAISNPVLRQTMLYEFADKCDTAAVNLKAKAMPGQATHVLLPMPSISPNQVYAPNYNNGDTVVLIRFPHAGRFEIPELTVNNNVAEAKKLFDKHKPKDAIGIHPKVAAQLSGADFDGDTVLVIPNNDRSIQTRKVRERLQNFDPKTEYKAYPGMKVIGKRQKNIEMGKVSNLITDMTIKGAPIEDIEKAVRHSMVVIDSEKHQLDWRRSEKDHDIAALKNRYQQKPDGRHGASTIVSQTKSPVEINQRERRGVDKETGAYIWRETGKTRTLPSGKEVPRTTKVPKMALTDDARTLLSKDAGPVEHAYADYANSMKSMALQARKEAANIKHAKRDPAMRAQYKTEVDSLRDKLADASANKPLERAAQAIGNSKYSALLRENPDMDDDHKQRVRNRCIAEARESVYGGRKPELTISDREWEAIQKGAVSATAQKQLFRYVNHDVLIDKALPKSAKTLTASKLASAKRLLANGYSYKEVADMLNVPESTLKSAL